MNYDFIFCPFCGATKWTIDKTGAPPAGIKGQLEYHKCSGCKNFTYTNLVAHDKSPGGIEYFKKTRYSVVAIIKPYEIVVSYVDKHTTFTDWDTGNILLMLNSAITFNWYKHEDLIDKIKKYLVFS